MSRSAWICQFDRRPPVSAVDDAVGEDRDAGEDFDDGAHQRPEACGTSGTCGLTSGTFTCRPVSSWRGLAGIASFGRSAPRSLGIAGRQTADLEQLQAECFELVDHAVQGGLIRERAGQQRVLSASARGQRRERLHHRRADRPTDADLVAPRLASPGRAVLGCHAISVGVRVVSAHRIVRTKSAV